MGDDNDSSLDTVNTVFTDDIPVDRANNPIIWDGLLASGVGTRRAVGGWAISTAFLESFFVLRAVSSSSPRPSPTTSTTFRSSPA